ncbi:2OG-Fe(II) oxygenase family protein [Amycolatopsis sp. GM8]|uniref:2OG-Fe(II) oxygenase family protein n=1 Tax=Amycolatopsis sp. GM8 TaxID=2896530 RepID=UPI001F43FEFA|nr:2OG-Fe(II) oxygenase family protein [Amycolatopsis sp. GM8]
MTTVLAPDWADREARSEPYRWLATHPGELFDLAVARDLVSSFPTDGFERRDATGRPAGKTYRNYSRTIVGPGSGPPADLPALWRGLVADLTSAAYGRDVARLLGQPVAAAVEIRLVRHAPGDWLGPHTDRADKLFSHIIYFNEDWRAEFGGRLDILGGNDSAAVVASVVPELGASALLARGPDSWHQVSDVDPGMARSRASLLTHGLR